MGILLIFAFVFGIIVGSFLNVLIYRLPRNIPIGMSRSFCPGCKEIIPWYRNIPLLSFLVQRGKCHRCGHKIPRSYFLVEFLAGLASVLLFPRLLGAESLVLYLFYFTVFSVFLVHFLIDVEHQVLPDSLNIYLGMVFLAYAIVFKAYWDWIGGALIGLLFPLAVTWLFYVLRGKVGLGGGDIKLYAALGIFLGIKGIIENIFLSCMLGALIGGAVLLIKKQDKDTPLAFGPFIILVAFLQIFFPEVFKKYIVLF